MGKYILDSRRRYSESRKWSRVRVENSPVLAEIIMKSWEEENVETDKRIRKFERYVNDSLGVWRGSKIELEEKVKKMEDKEKGIKL